MCLQLENCHGYQRTNLFRRCCTDTQYKAPPSPTMFLYRAPQCQPQRKKKASLPTVKNAVHKKQSSYIFHCLYEWTSGHLWKGNKMTACAQSAWWRHQISWCENTCIVGCCKLHAHCGGITEGPVMSRSRVELIGNTDEKPGGFSWACLLPIVSFFRPSADGRMWLGIWPGTPNVVQIYLTLSRYCVTVDLSRQGIIRLFFYFWIRLTFPTISQIAFDIKAKGTSAGTFFTLVEGGEKY